MEDSYVIYMIFNFTPVLFIIEKYCVLHHLNFCKWPVYKIFAYRIISVQKTVFPLSPYILFLIIQAKMMGCFVYLNCPWTQKCFLWAAFIKGKKKANSQCNCNWCLVFWFSFLFYKIWVSVAHSIYPKVCKISKKLAPSWPTSIKIFKCLRIKNIYPLLLSYNKAANTFSPFWLHSWSQGLKRKYASLVTLLLFC